MHGFLPPSLSGTTYAYLAKSYSSLTTRHGALRTCHKAISVTQRDRGPEYARTCYMCCISEPQLKNQLSRLKGQTGDGPRSRNQGGLPQEPDTITSCMRFPQATDHSITSMQCKLVRTLDRHGTWWKKNHNAHLYIMSRFVIFLLRRGSSSTKSRNYNGCLACFYAYTKIAGVSWAGDSDKLLNIAGIMLFIDIRKKKLILERNTQQTVGNREVMKSGCMTGSLSITSTCT